MILSDTKVPGQVTPRYFKYFKVKRKHLYSEYFVTVKSLCSFFMQTLLWINYFIAVGKTLIVKCFLNIDLLIDIFSNRNNWIVCQCYLYVRCSCLTLEIAPWGLLKYSKVLWCYWGDFDKFGVWYHYLHPRSDELSRGGVTHLMNFLQLWCL